MDGIQPKLGRPIASKAESANSFSSAPAFGQVQPSTGQRSSPFTSSPGRIGSQAFGRRGQCKVDEGTRRRPGGIGPIRTGIGGPAEEQRRDGVEDPDPPKLFRGGDQLHTDMGFLPCCPQCTVPNRFSRFLTSGRPAHAVPFSGSGTPSAFGVRRKGLSFANHPSSKGGLRVREEMSIIAWSMGNYLLISVTIPNSEWEKQPEEEHRTSLRRLHLFKPFRVPFGNLPFFPVRLPPALRARSPPASQTGRGSGRGCPGEIRG